jgi:hypothetical protein
MYPLFLYARHEPLSGIPFDTGCRPFDIPQNRSDGMKPILNEGFSEKSCLLLLENSKGNQGNRTKNYYSGSPLFFHENWFFVTFGAVKYANRLYLWSQPAYLRE